MDFSWKKAWIPMIVVFLFVELMLSIASIINNSEILFPEASALAVGCWVFKEERWNRNFQHICLMPTLSASLAIILNNCPISIFMKESLALILVVAALHFLKSLIGPSISAAILPLVLGIHSWDYVLSVFVLTFVIMLGAIKNRTSNKHPIDKQSTRKVAYSFLIVLFILFCWVLKLEIGIIPPLLVVTYEWFSKTEINRLFVSKQITLLTLCALIGAGCHQIFPHLTLLVGLISVLTSLQFMLLLGVKLPPAFAISLLPLIIGELPVWKFPLTVLVESWALSEMAIWYIRLEPIFSLKFLSFKQVLSK
ncbi:HPP family protein [Neobacillus sp. PS3-12]|uniref:HPP family protein n=1 Tax=Neobacillus sp. PS3-12 TaxID=3070677 RepID=UPI0027E0A542|nr:HPP family protein [Neobacillus sp. PS3-12]WML51121.1 HPP family protein [Neobacillus sp. PS3-12]